MHAASPTRRFAWLALVLALGGLAACDHKERRNDNPAQESAAVADRTMARRVSELRSRQTQLSGRIGALAVPDGTEDATLTATLGEVQNQIGLVNAACTAADAAAEQARANATAALASPDRISAQRQVEAGVVAFEQAAMAADAAMNQLEPKVIAGEQIMKRLLAQVASEVARLQRLAIEGGNADFSDINFSAGTADFDFARPPSKASLERLSRFAASCPELRVGITGHTSKEGDAAQNRALSLARADAVKGYLVAQGVKPEVIARTAGLGSTKTAVDEPDPGTPAEAAMPPAQLEMIRQRNRRVNVEVITPCGKPATGGPSDAAGPAIRVAPPVEQPPAAVDPHAGHNH